MLAVYISKQQQEWRIVVIKAVETGKHSIMSPLELVLSDSENVSILGPVERWELAVDENTPAAALRLLCLEDIGGQLSHEIISNPNTPRDAVQLVETRLMSRYERVETAKSTDNPYILAGLASNEDNLVRYWVAWNPETSITTLTILANDEDEYVRATVVENSSTPIETLTILANDKSWYVRKAVALSANTLQEILTILAKDEDELVRGGVASNHNTPPEILIMLAKDEKKYVREVVAENMGTPPETLTMLASDEDDDVREAAISTIAKN